MRHTPVHHWHMRGPGRLPVGWAVGVAAILVASPAAASEPAAEPEAEDAPVYPRLVLGVHGLLGPHSPGEEVCTQESRVIRCDHTGRFLGAGGGLDLRIRMHRFLYGSVRFFALANAFGRKPESLHDGLLAPAAGLAIMTDLALLRLEFVAPFSLGDDTYRAPASGAVATEKWGHAAGILSLGARIPFHERVRGELTAGVHVGPGVDRASPINGDKKGPLVSFQVGLGCSFDLVR